jgi:hypothetical protein
LSLFLRRTLPSCPSRPRRGTLDESSEPLLRGALWFGTASPLHKVICSGRDCRPARFLAEVALIHATGAANLPITHLKAKRSRPPRITYHGVKWEHKLGQATYRQPRERIEYRVLFIYSEVTVLNTTRPDRSSEQSRRALLKRKSRKLTENRRNCNVHALCVGGRHQWGYWKLGNHPRRPVQLNESRSSPRIAISELCNVYFIGVILLRFDHCAISRNRKARPKSNLFRIIFR